MSPIAWPCLRVSRRLSHAHNRTVSSFGRRAVLAVRGYLRLTNKYTFVLVGTKRMSWFAASKQTWLLLTRTGAEAIVNDDASDRFLLSCCYVGAAATSLMGNTLQVAMGDWLVSLLVVAWFGFVGVSLPLTVLDACVSTLIVSFAQVRITC
jgi:hypothetical protein